MQLFSVLYLFFSPLEAVALVLSESSISQPDCRAHVTCEDTSYILAFIKKERLLSLMNKN